MGEAADLEVAEKEADSVEVAMGEAADLEVAEKEADSVEVAMGEAADLEVAEKEAVERGLVEGDKHPRSIAPPPAHPVAYKLDPGFSLRSPPL